MRSLLSLFGHATCGGAGTDGSEGDCGSTADTAVLLDSGSVMPRSTMRIEHVTTHGTPSGNDSLTGDDILAAMQEGVACL